MCVTETSALLMGGSPNDGVSYDGLRTKVIYGVKTQ